MAAKRLRWSGTKVSSFSDGRACLVVQFLDQEGNLLEWVPAWSQVQALFERACNTEVVNKPDSGWVEGFAKTANDVFRSLEPHHEAYKVTGRLERVSEGSLIIRDGDSGVAEELPAAFRLTDQFFRYWLGSNVTALVVNGYATRLWMKALVPTVPFNAFFGGGKQEYEERVIEYPSQSEQVGHTSERG
jgi:hypothetical protein